MTKKQSAGRPQGNPSRPKPPQGSVADMTARWVAAGMFLPDLTTQFTGLGPGTQLRLFRLVDLIGGMSHEEKVETRVQLTGIRRLDSTTEDLAELLAAVESLVLNIDRIATPVIDGEPTGNLAERFLQDYGVKLEG